MNALQTKQKYALGLHKALTQMLSEFMTVVEASLDADGFP